MTPIAALHTAARRYCEERHAHWWGVYAALPPFRGTYTPAALDVFPRYQQLDAIQRAVEVFMPEDFATLDEARALLQAAGELARSPMLANTHSDLERAATADERARFVAYVGALDDAALALVPPMPFRRVLGFEEAAALERQREARFGRWYGGVCGSVSGTLISGHLTFALPLGPDPTPALQALLAPMASRLFELNELTEHFELDLALCSFHRSEAFWVPRTLDFMVYASHEGTLTVAGDALVAAVRAQLPGWLPLGT